MTTMTTKTIISNIDVLNAIKASSYYEDGDIECPVEHFAAMICFIANVCGGWYDAARCDDNNYLISHDVTDSRWEREVKKLKK